MTVQRVSQRDIARRAKVHFTTVSLALRDSLLLPKETKERIQKLAEEMGYRPDPMLSALQAYRKTVKTSNFEGTIAWINTFKIPSQLYPPQTYTNFIAIFLHAARKRCEELGYRLEEFNLAEIGAARLSKIFQTRNIQGLLLPPQPHDQPHLNFDWENYSAVTFGYSLRSPQLHLVANAQYSTARKGVRVLREYGYRRIGFVTTRITDERTDQNFSSGYLAEQRKVGVEPPEDIPMLVLADVDAKQQKQEFIEWYKKYQPTVILSMYYRVPEFMEELGISYSECGAALLLLNPLYNRKYAGIDQNDSVIGSSAVDFLVAMLHRNERGIPQTPLRILVEGKWVDGDTVPNQGVVRSNFRGAPV
jgi:LacI family repressor for deo operon, udp, cdd, tsx, nupC, and nupG